MSNNFWSQSRLEPKRKFRWLLHFANAPQFIAKSVTKPGFSVGNSAHAFLQHTFNFPGRVTWTDINITLVDPITPDSCQSLYNIIREAGYALPTEFTPGNPRGAATVSKEKMVNSLGPMIRIDQIGTEGSDEVVESWLLRNPLITSVNFDSLDYSSDELLNITIGIKYDWAELGETSTPATLWQPRAG
tara:strand:+ start:1811 stop:2374 length:564 start_codon:yes stop_codon:yes gene_type:complete